MAMVDLIRAEHLSSLPLYGPWRAHRRRKSGGVRLLPPQQLVAVANGLGDLGLTCEDN